MSILIKDAEMPERCEECLLFKSENRPYCGLWWCMYKEIKSVGAPYDMPRPGWCPISDVELCEDAVPRKSVEYICRKNTISTNPYEHKHHEKFIQFMDDPEIADFGRWQHSNGFNTALVAVKCDLDKIPSVTL